MLEVVLLVVVMLLVGAWALLGVIYSISGTWERDDIENQDSALGRERVTLAQFGPLVLGRREVAGGYQSFFGIGFANTFYLSRRDHGQLLLKKEGFPEPIAKLLEGEIMMRMKLKISPDKLFLAGLCEPYKVEFTHEPPRITAKRRVAPAPRRYRRVELVRTKSVAHAPYVTHFI